MLFREMCSPQVFSPPRLKFQKPDDYFAFGRPSPTFSDKSHDRWAARHIRALEHTHEILPPTHFATLKFNRCETVATIKALQQSLTRAIGYFNRKGNDHIAIFGVLEGEWDCSVHLHLLIRTTLDDPAPLIRKKLAAFNKKSGTIATLPYCEPPNDVGFVTRYPFKLGQDKLLFESNTGLRFVYQCGGYFLDNKKSDSERERLFHIILAKHEAEAETVIGFYEDHIAQEKPKRTLGELPSLRLEPPTLLRNKAPHPLLNRKRTKARPRIRSPCEWP